MHNEKSLSTVIAEFKSDAADFIDTRVQLFRAEMSAKINAIKVAAPLLGIAVVLGLIAVLCLTGCIVAFIALGLGGGIASWAIALAIVGVVYLLMGAGAGYFGYKHFTAEGMTPTRTVKVLKQDQVWIQNEARSQV